MSLINTCQCIILLCTNGLSIEPTTLGLKDVVRPLAIMQSQPVASMYTISAFRIKYTARENHSTTLLERTILWLKRTSYGNITTSLQKNGENGGFEFKAICFSVHRLSLFEYIEKRTWALPSFLTDPVRTPKFNMAHDLQKIGLSFLDFQVDEFNVPLWKPLSLNLSLILTLISLNRSQSASRECCNKRYCILRVLVIFKMRGSKWY